MTLAMQREATENPPPFTLFVSGMAGALVVRTTSEIPQPQVNFGDERASNAWQARELRQHWASVGKRLRWAMREADVVSRNRDA